MLQVLQAKCLPIFLTSNRDEIIFTSINLWRLKSFMQMFYWKHHRKGLFSPEWTKKYCFKLFLRENGLLHLVQTQGLETLLGFLKQDTQTTLFEASTSVGINVDCISCFFISNEKVCLFEIGTSVLKKFECKIFKLI